MNKKNKSITKGKAVYLVIAGAFLVNFAGNYPQYQLSPIAHLLMEKYQLGLTQFSSLFSAAMIPGIVLGIVAGVICDRFGAKKSIAIAGMISLIGVVGRIFAYNFSSLFVCMVISGIVNTFLNSNLSKIIGSWVHPDKIGIAIGVALAGATASMAVAMGTTAMLPSIKTAFIIAAVISVAVLIFWVFFVRDNQENDRDQLHVQPAGIMEGLKIVAKNKHIWTAGIAVGLVLSGSMCLNTFLPQALQGVRGMDAVKAGVLTAAIMFGNIAGSIIGPVICMKIGKMKTYLLSFCVFGGAGVAFAWLAPEGILLMAGLFMTGFFLSGLIAQLLSIPVMLPEIGPRYAGTAGGFLGTVQLLLGVVLPSYVIAPIIGDSFRTLYIVGGVLVVIAGVLTLRLPELLKENR